MTRRIEDFLALNTAALEALPPVEQFAVLADLAERAGPWLRDHRGIVLERLRWDLGSDVAVAEAVGVTPQALADLGDGPTIAGGYKPRLLRRGAELILEHLSDHAGQTAQRAISTALELLCAPGRPGQQKVWSAALRIVQAAPSINRHSLAADEKAMLSRAVAHAVWVKEHPPK